MNALWNSFETLLGLGVEEDMRLSGHIDDLSKLARVERSGDISFIKK